MSGTSRRLRLAVDARVAIEDTRGIGRYVRAILRRLVARDDIELALLANGVFPGRFRRAYETALGSADFSLAARATHSHDLVWHPANGTFFSTSRPSVVTIHDAVPFRYPHADPKRRVHAQMPFLRSARTARRIIAVSAFGRSEVHEVFGVPLERIVAIAHGVEPSFMPGPAEPLPRGLTAQGYLLFVGDPIGEARKNFSLLYEAHRQGWPHGDGPPLVVAGPRAPDLPGVVHAGSFGDDLRAPENDGLRALYRGAIALALPSYHETFGMPMVESMACGTPVVASHASCLPEIGGNAALYVPADDATAWADALRRMTADTPLRDRLRTAGLERAARYNWDESAGRHVELFRSVAAS